MIKKIIFDIDNTLMEFPKNFEIGFKKVLDRFNLNISPKQLYDAIGTYEKNKNNVYYDKEKLLNTVNDVLNLNLNMKFMEEFFKMYNRLITPIPEETIDTLKYLRDKYELVIISNWFTDSQKSRLKEAGILQYFDEVYGTDIIPMKPRKEGFNSVIKDLKPEECVMIGDNLEMDIKTPYEMGMNVYHLNRFGTSKYPTIRKIEDLKEML